MIHVQPSAVKRTFAFLVAIVLVGVLTYAAFAVGFQLGQETPKIIVVKEAKNITPPESVAVDFGTFWQAWDVINTRYLKNKDVTPQQKAYGAIRGLVGSLKDPHSEYFDPSDNQKFQQDIEGNFGGIGAEIGKRDEQIVIVAPLKNTPASRAGLKAGDMILKIDSAFTDGLTVDEAIRKIRGPKGTEVALFILRKEWERPQEFKITRDTIVVPTLDVEEKGDIAYMKLYSFNANTNRLFYEEVTKALMSGARGMLLDLRNNPGGYLEVAVDIAGWFVDRGTVVVSEVGTDGAKQDFLARGNAALNEFPVVVLVNEGSASAAEILAGALRIHRSAKLVGEKTFGKGSVQQLESLKDGSSLKLTVAQWVLPNGEIIEEKGLEPDVEVKLAEADVKAKKDPQFEKGMEILRQQIASSTKNFLFVVQ